MNYDNLTTNRDGISVDLVWLFLQIMQNINKHSSWSFLLFKRSFHISQKLLHRRIVNSSHFSRIVLIIDFVLLFSPLLLTIQDLTLVSRKRWCIHQLPPTSQPLHLILLRHNLSADSIFKFEWQITNLPLNELAGITLSVLR